MIPVSAVDFILF